MTSISAGHIILTPTQSVESGRPTAGIEPRTSSPGAARSTEEIDNALKHTKSTDNIIIMGDFNATVSNTAMSRSW